MKVFVIQSILLFSLFCHNKSHPQVYTHLFDTEISNFNNGSAAVGVQDTLIVNNQFEAIIELLSKEQGGRSTPFYNNFSPRFKMGNLNVSGAITLSSVVQMIRPGEKRSVSVKLTSAIEMEIGQKFDILELEKKIGSGTITKIKK